MADNSQILKEYLVALGFKVDQNSLNKMDAALGKTAKAALGFASILVAAGTAATAFVDKVATKMEDLYWSSVRLRDGAANIQDFELELSKVGGTADGALSSLENFATYLRTNPAGEGLLHNLGVQTRDANGNLRSTIAMVKDFAHLPMPYWLKVRFASRFGIDERSLQAIIRLAPNAENKVSSLYKRAGIDADKAAEASKDFKNEMRDLESEFGVIATVMEVRLLPAVRAFVGLVATVAGWLLDLDKLTDGLSTDFITMAGAIWAVNTALSVTFGAGILKMLGTLLANVALLAVDAFPALAEAIWGVGTALLAAGGWWLLLFAAIAAGAVWIIAHWDKVKDYFNSFVGWLRDKYNAVAKYLGLPQWTSEPASRAVGPGDSAQTGGRDFRQEERNLGPNSLWGAQTGGGDQSGAAGGGGARGANAALTGKALAFFQKAGWSAAQAAGIVANLVHESGLNARSVGDSGSAYGVAQWHRDRQEAFAAWAGHDIRSSTLEEQLAFVNQELTRGAERFAGKMLGAATNAAQAGAAVSKYYERPKDQEGEMRSRAATAEHLISGAKLAPNSSRAGGVTINQKTDIKVSGSDAPSTARAVGREQSRVNGDLVRNFAGAAT